LPVRTPDLAPIQFASPQLIHIAQHADPQQVKAAAAVGALVLFFLAVRTAWTAVFVMLACFASLAFAVYLAKWVLAKDEGTADMQEVSDAIREGADGFFATQYNLIGKLAGVVAIAIYLIYSARALTKEQMDAGIGQQTFAILTTFSFCTGALASAASGYVGMWVSVRANVRVAGAARRSAREALMVALRAGGFAAIVVVSMTVLGVSVLFTFYSFMFNVGRPGGTSINEMPLMLVGYGFGASFVALFAQLGGGIYTKAADVGADLVGKVEAGIPEDDPRNPAVIADLVGDNVGDCSARGADLFESIAAEVISAMILGATMAKKAQIADSTGFIMFPLVVHALDCLVSAAGIMSVNERVSLNPRMGGQKEDPYEIIKGGYRVSMGLSIVGFGIATRVMLYVEDAPSAWMHFFACGMVGTASAYAFVFIAQYYTDYKYPPVRVIAEASTTGHGTNIIAGVGVGMESTAAPVICISAAIITAYWFGQTSGLTDKSTGEPTGGLFGTAVATMGMLSTAAYVLTMDVFGPIADNAGGIVEMSDQPESVRECTDALDAVGNTTKATTKGYAIGSAALASFLLFSAYMDEVEAFTGKPFKQVDIAVPEVFVAGLLGSMIVYLFTAFACTAVGRSAQEVVTEVRRQFRERPGIMTREEKPDYGRCVSIVAQSALREMIKPGILAVGGPIVIGVVFRMIGAATGQELLGAKAVAGMLMFATVAGILMALFLNTAGGAWDNAKKYVETGAHGGKGSEAHKAAVTGDTVGDPFKDTAGPSIHVLIKMLATITLVMAPMFLD
jgi:inorganic pyrophosphatase|tara:strand:- start:2682 stop:5054 length:2373 start_codon:yes stop_codon:yes gene_type:complete